MADVMDEKKKLELLTDNSNGTLDADPERAAPASGLSRCRRWRRSHPKRSRTLVWAITVLAGIWLVFTFGPRQLIHQTHTSNNMYIFPAEPGFSAGGQAGADSAWTGAAAAAASFPFGGSDANLTTRELRRLMIETPDRDKLREWMHVYAGGTHLAGKSRELAERTQQLWQTYGIDSKLVEYEVCLNFPRDRSLQLIRRVDDDDNKIGSNNNNNNNKFWARNRDGEEKWVIEFEARLDEDKIKEDPTSGIPNRIPPFHGYSASGDVEAPFVYVNHGSYEDFEDLVEKQVPLAGKIAIARYGGVFRGLKVKRAQELGIIGVLIYSDPGDDGDVTKRNGHKAYPHGPARQPSSVQRGSVQFLSIMAGDPTTPGYASKRGVDRKSRFYSTPQIASLPISYEDAVPILKALNGHGPPASDLSARWRSGGLDKEGVKYNVGPTPDHVRLKMVNDVKYEIAPVWNVIGELSGRVANEAVVIGNHRDAWAVGGASDPSSGSAALNEVVRTFGAASARGWKPLRSIVFASWDAEEYGLVGSTEWVEDNLSMIKHRVVAYLNADAPVMGHKLSAQGAPLLHDLLRRAARHVPAPERHRRGGKGDDERDSNKHRNGKDRLSDHWDGTVHPVGSGSDFTAFQHVAGVPIIDFGFHGDGESPVYHYHSNYDSIHAFETFFDPHYEFTLAATRLWGVMAAELADEPVLPFVTSDYANSLLEYAERARDLASSRPRARERKVEYDIAAFVGVDRADYETGSLGGGCGHRRQPDYSFSQLFTVLNQFRVSAKAFDAHAASLRTELAELGQEPWWRNPLRYFRLMLSIRHTNSAYRNIEQAFLLQRGLDSRPFFKHVVFAPALWNGYRAETFPGLTEAIEARDGAAIEAWERALVRIVQQAGDVMRV